MAKPPTSIETAAARLPSTPAASPLAGAVASAQRAVDRERAALRELDAAPADQAETPAAVAKRAEVARRLVPLEEGLAALRARLAESETGRGGPAVETRGQRMRG